ncbi:MAG: SdpI family protein [Clostridia bacterium]|nr:SdpI family protein [Clostridia bacterium]
MAFWIFMYICDLLIPLLMVGFGWYFRRYPPENINYWFGYRTTMSTKNQDTWQFAQRYYGNLSWKLGWPTLIISAIVPLFYMGRSTEFVGVCGGILCLLQLVLVLYPIIPIEIALRKTFDKNGNRRQ